MTMANKNTDDGDKNDNATADEIHRGDGMLFSVEETPPWYLCLLLGFQHYLTAFAPIISVPIVLSDYFCMDSDAVGLGEVIGTIFFVSGICTLIQTTFGIRLSVVQGGSLSFITPAIAILSQQEWTCPYVQARENNGSAVNFTSLGLPEVGSDDHREIWMKRLREIQGAIMVASLFQITIGFSGILGAVLRFVGPLVITPTITLIGMSLFAAAASKASQQWWIAIMTMVFVTLFSQFLKKLKIPCITGIKDKSCTTTKLPIFDLFPVLLAMVLSWCICAILTATDVLPHDPNKWGYTARTDIKNYVLKKSEWFRVPYPGQWGTPTVSTASVLGMMAAVIASMIESVGDYYACARLSKAPPPPTHAVNRGIGLEGIGCLLAGAIGSGNGTTSYSANIAIIGLTKVGSRSVVQACGILMILLGCLGKFGALFATIPDPVIGGLFFITFGMITSIGLSNLHCVDMNSSRNLFVLGTSLFFGFSMPVWMIANPTAINTGNDVVDQILTVLLSTSMFVGGVVGFVLDNAIPGTDEERGIKKWRTVTEGDNFASPNSPSMHIYDIPLIQKCLNKVKLFRYIPICPTFMNKDRAEIDEVDLTVVKGDTTKQGDKPVSGLNQKANTQKANTRYNTQF